MHRLLRLLILLPLLLSFAGVQAAPPPQPVPWQEKVAPSVLAAAAQGQAEFIVFLEQQADLSAANLLQTKKEKGAYVFARLTETAERAQKPILRALQARAGEPFSAVEFRSFWVANMIWVRGDLDLIQELAQRSDVAHLYANPKVHFSEPLPPSLLEQSPLGPDAPATIEWNITKVKAPDVWALGYTGQGVVIGGQDTGYDWDHPALKQHYRGWNNATSTANHNYNWHDAIHSGGGVCGANSAVPCDDHYHGTHTMGSMVGDDGGSNQIGMAPGAKWIGCRNMDQGVGTSTTYSECYQWFIAPTDLSGANPRTDLAPDVINNSWGCPPSELGCDNPDVMLDVVKSVRAAGILTVHSAGNDGYLGCGSVKDPAAIYDESFTVGNTTSSDNIASSSSRGPVTVDGSNRMKPDISAPGSIIRSSIPTGYATLSGTSMAGPHVAGLVALLISAQPALAGQVDLIEALITRNAVPRTTTQTCGGVPGSQVPNNTYGWGRIDALATVQNALHNFSIRKSASHNWIAPGETLTYTLEITQLYPISVTDVVMTDVLPVNTTLFDATPPYTLVGDTVRWDFDHLDAHETRSLQLIVQAPPDGNWLIVNQLFGVKSSEIPNVETSSPIYTFIANFIYLFPIFFR